MNESKKFENSLNQCKCNKCSISKKTKRINKGEKKLDLSNIDDINSFLTKKIFKLESELIELLETQKISK